MLIIFTINIIIRYKCAVQNFLFLRVKIKLEYKNMFTQLQKHIYLIYILYIRIQIYYKVLTIYIYI